MQICKELQKLDIKKKHVHIKKWSIDLQKELSKGDTQMTEKSSYISYQGNVNHNTFEILSYTHQNG